MSLKKHPQTGISLYTDLRNIQTKKTSWYVNRSVRADLIRFLHNNTFINCPNCGGLIPDLVIGDKERRYCFTCTRIEENGKRIRESNYKRLGFHILSKYMLKQLKKKPDCSLREFVNAEIETFSKKKKE